MSGELVTLYLVDIDRDPVTLIDYEARLSDIDGYHVFVLTGGGFISADEHQNPRKGWCKTKAAAIEYALARAERRVQEAEAILHVHKRRRDQLHQMVKDALGT